MATISETKETLRKAVLDSYRDEYKEYADNWRNLETKAQGNVAVAGIFIAGVFAFITKTDSALNEIEKFFFFLAIGFLVSSVIFSIFVLRTRSVPVPPLGSFMDYTVKRLLVVDNADFHERLQRFGSDHFNTWRKVMAETEKAIRLKADRLWIAQILLMGAILTVAILTFIKVAIR